MTKNPNYRANSATHKKGSYSQESSPLHTYKAKKESNNNPFHPSDLDTQLRLSNKVGTKKVESRPLTANVFINNLNVQLNSSQVNNKKPAVPLSASITNRKTSKQYSALTQKEEAALAAFRDGKSKQKLKGHQASFDDAMASSSHGGASYDLRKNPMTLVSRHNSEASNDLARSSYIPKFKGSDPSNKFALRSPPKVFAQQEQTSTMTASAKFKKPNGRGNQKSFDVNAGTGPLNKYTPYLNTYLRPPVTANNSPKNRESETKLEQSETAIGRGLSNSAITKTTATKNVTSAKPAAKSSTPMTKHRKTPSYDGTKRNESLAQKTLTPPILDRMRKSADCGDYWNGSMESYHKSSFQFAIRTRAGVAPNGTRKINQDSFIFHTNYGKKSDRYLLGVCDGHGMNGHLVSGFVKEALPIYLLADPSFQSNLGMAMTNAFELCHQKLLVGDVDCRFSGTTSVVVMMDGNKIITANAGDSRAIIGTFGNKGWDYREITTDHKPDTPQEAHRIMKSGGRIEPFKDFDGGFVGPSRVWLANQDIPGLAMSRSIGDFVAASVGVSCIPEIKEFSINPNDRFMIVASDGVWEFIENIDVVKIVAPFYEQNNIEGACDFLLGVALKRWQEEEEVVVDDITLIMVFF